MKVRVRFEMGDKKIDEVVAGASADDLLTQAKARVAKELGWKGMFLNAMSPLQFAQTAVRLYNERFKADHPLPQSADEFFRFGEQTGNITVLEP